MSKPHLRCYTLATTGAERKAEGFAAGPQNLSVALRFVGETWPGAIGSQ